MSRPGGKIIRCAIYTRKSTEEGLEQDFNSLDAQREACSAYILSQASEGWLLSGERYDDGGISGGTLARPALQRLLADVAGGEIDILEHIGAQPGVVHANLHTGKYNHTKQNGRGAQKPLPTSCSDFHRYQLAWTENEMLIGVDDRAYMRVRNSEPGDRGAWPFDKPFYLILNLAMGGDWAGSKGIDDASLPQKFEVDYVRVWEMPAAVDASARATEAPKSN